MREVFYNKKRYIHSRTRDGFLELVSLSSGRLIEIRESTPLSEAKTASDTPLVIPGIPLFKERKEGWLELLRDQRIKDIHLMLSMRKGSKKGSRGGKVLVKKKKIPKSASPEARERLESLPDHVREAIGL